MTVYTWSFESSPQGWQFVDASTGGASATMVYSLAQQALFCTLPDNGGVGHSIANMFAPITDIPVQIGDTIEFDYSAVGGGGLLGNHIVVTVDDAAPFTLNSNGDSGAATLTGTFAAAGTLNQFFVEFEQINPTVTKTRSVLEIRLTVAASPVPTAGKIRTVSSFLASLGGGGFGKIAAISADGLFIYITGINEFGLPILIKFSTGLLLDGEIVFEPGAGTIIGVETGDQNEDVVLVCGQFDGTNVAEKSTDAGSSFAVVDDGSIGIIRAFVMGPNDDNRIMVFDETNGSILETINNGEAWTTINAAVTPEINDIARLGENIQETVAGNEGAANDNVDFSVNSGANLEDLVLPVNQNVTKVIVN
jgi:hypothetical protein